MNTQAVRFLRLKIDGQTGRESGLGVQTGAGQCIGMEGVHFERESHTAKFGLGVAARTRLEIGQRGGNPGNTKRFNVPSDGEAYILTSFGACGTYH